MSEKTPEMKLQECPPRSYINNNSDLLISIVIPLYNEEKTIVQVLKKLPNHHAYEIIVVDDGSTDRSVQKLMNLGFANLKILHHQKNLGYGAALKTGFEHVNGDLIITMDSDGQHDPEDIKNILKPILMDKADVVIGSRYLGHCNYKVPLYTLIGEFCITVFLLTLFRQKINNNQSGYRCFKRDVIKRIHKIESSGMGFTTEFLFECAFNGLNILEAPIKLNYRKHGRSYVKLFEVFKTVVYCFIIYFFKQYLFKIRYKNRNMVQKEK